MPPTLSGFDNPLLIVEGLLCVFFREQVKIREPFQLMAIFESVHISQRLAGGDEATLLILNIDTVSSLLHEALKEALSRGAK